MDLKDDPSLIAQYDDHHKKVWPEVLQSLKASGITSMEIYRWRNRLFMIIEVTADFSFERKAQMDAANSKVQEWENLMSRFQQSQPGSRPKWEVMEKVFDTKKPTT